MIPFHPTGSIEVICGSMFSGKTEELLRRLKRAQIARQKIQVFKPKIDNRYSDTHVQSHDAGRILSLPVDRARDILKFLEDNTRVVGIDEAQFFDESLIDVAQKVAYRGVRVIAAGLDMDFRGLPFGPMPKLLAIAEHVTKLAAVCVVCGGPASRTQRIGPQSTRSHFQEDLEDPQAALPFPTSGAPLESKIVVGAQELYEPRCRFCHEPAPSRSALIAPHVKEPSPRHSLKETRTMPTLSEGTRTSSPVK